MPVIRKKRQNTIVHTDTFGAVELRYLEYDDTTYAYKALTKFRNGREYTLHLLHRQLVSPQVSYDDFALAPDNELRGVARAFIHNEPLEFKHFKETVDEELFENLRASLQRRWAELLDHVNVSLKPIAMDIQSTMSAIASASVKSIEAIRIAIDQSNYAQQSIARSIASAFEPFRTSVLELEAIRSAIPSALFSITNDQTKALAEIAKTLQMSVPQKAFFQDISRAAAQILSVHAKSMPTFGQQLAQAMSLALEFPAASKNPSELVERLEEERLESLPKERISLEGFALLVAVITMLLTLYQIRLAIQQQQESRSSSELQIDVLRHLLESTNRIVRRAEELIPARDYDTYYVVERPVDLRGKPTTKSVSILRLYPNQKVKLVQRRHKWIYVECFDFLEAVPRSGWIYKTFARMLSPSKGIGIAENLHALTDGELLSQQTFAEILAPIREGFRKSGMTEEQLDALFEEARQKVHQEHKTEKE